jgi:hypothetical protein
MVHGSTWETFWALLVLGALVGLLVGAYFSWIALMLAEPLLAVLSAVLLQRAGFGVLPGTAMVVACLAVSQIAYVVGLQVRADGPEDRTSRPHDEADQDPS